MSQDRLAVVAHELRSPVAALVAIAEALATRGAELPPEERRRLLELAFAACRNVERLVADAAVASVLLERLDAGGVVHDAADAAALAGGNVRAVVVGTFLVDADPQRLRQALDNLIENAVAHSPSGGEVVVEARLAAGSVLLSVADQGDGIDPADAERVFEAGVRLTGARPGSGLGLALVREIAEAHGGRVELQSAPGQGATFTLVLPCASSARA